MDAYDPEPWHDLFVMTGGAAAALAGLVFVAVSLNYEGILKFPSLPRLAVRSLSLLIGVLLMSAFSLVPGQPRAVLGVEILVLGLVLAAVALRTSSRNLAEHALQRSQVSLVVVQSVVASVPAVVAGVSIVAGAGGGLYWLLAAIVAQIVAASYNAWVLLIEVRR